jgi:hypothetical protein
MKQEISSRRLGEASPSAVRQGEENVTKIMTTAISAAALQ